MGLRTNPTQRQRRLGHELRKLRITSGMSAVEAGEHVDLGGPHLSHIEGGRTAIPEVKLRKLVEIYGCKYGTYVDALLDMSKPNRSGWWRSFKQDVDARALDLAELESSSRQMCGFETVNIPGLLQTPEYVSALLDTSPIDAAASKRFYDFRIKRQDVLTRESPAEYHAVIHEAALHMHFVDTDVLRRQLTHLIEVSQLPHITIQVIPFRAGPLPAVGSPFVLFSDGTSGLDTVYMEHDVVADFLSDQEHLGRYRSIFDRLTTLALPPLTLETERKYTTQRDSMSLIQHLLYIL